jgi:hypothetical protein
LSLVIGYWGKEDGISNIEQGISNVEGKKRKKGRRVEEEKTNG